jgi:hypothetical protein
MVQKTFTTGNVQITRDLTPNEVLAFAQMGDEACRREILKNDLGLAVLPADIIAALLKYLQ